MIVKFHARGKGGGSGPVDYLLGRERNREGARVLRGAPEEVRELIDATPFAKKYTSGVLSFAEQTLPPGERERVMESFERVLMPGLEKNQYSILWVEHQDKGRLELNFVIPNMELASGKRLQPYYDRADRPRINAWQTLVNHHYGLHDPNAPENRRTLVTPNNLPKAKQEAAEAITRGLEALYHAGALKTRQDVTEALTAAGFEVVRTTRSSISIADPEGGRNLRLKGALYEQSFTNGDRLREETERACRLYREHAEQRVQEARLYPSLTALCVTGGIFLASWGLIQWQESRIAANILAIRDQEETLAKLREKTWGVTYHEGRNGKFLVLPSGVKGENNWTVEKKNAVRLVRE
ncbi:plasmid mobilization relaxase MbeA (plasmid) [Escherichia coli]